MIRNAIIAVIVTVVIGGIIYNLDSTTEYVKETITETVEVTPEWASDTDAVEAAQAVMRKKALTEEINVLDGDIEALKATYNAELDRLIEEKTKREKELGSF